MTAHVVSAAVPALEVHDLSVAYRSQPVVWNVDFELPPGVLCGVVGPNGAGKSTLFKAILGLLPTASGFVRVLGKGFESQRLRVGYIPQRESVDWDFPTDALDVVLMGRYGRLGWFRRPSKADRALAMECLEQVGMADFARRQISQLSGGQQQRVFMARALAQQADLYFLDEPFAGVDAATERSIIDLLRALRDRGATVLVIHHDLQSVAEYFDWILMLNMRLVACGPTADTFTPENLHRTYGGRLTLLAEAVERLRAAREGRTAS
ncbi:MAG: metal ABC transporter ATP-binding protein [Candidatus Sumerlaeia bacterium]|nr:metal ABC transporter ATP-binding protein [Candidatus Sumerlaeia bacterium]